MSLSPRSRFTVLKRDGFTCQYCGRKPPAVVLHVDHITSRYNGGSDDEGNLITSCAECNHGKGRHSIEDGACAFCLDQPGTASVEVGPNVFVWICPACLHDALWEFWGVLHPERVGDGWSAPVYCAGCSKINETPQKRYVTSDVIGGVAWICDDCLPENLKR
jgi:hypothetical protein